MTGLIGRAEAFATQTHKRIDHRRKYSFLPYSVHLQNVAEIVSSVVDDEEMIAAAWLHDIVEDTPATFHDITKEFGPEISQLVRELTDVSRPGDGNRAERKEIDRRHIAEASPRSKTIKLADLIDNCEDICKHDARFGPVFLKETALLLGVLEEGDERLFSRAKRVHEKWDKRLSKGKSKTPHTVPTISDDHASRPLQGRRAMRLFIEAFAASDIVEPLASFDADADCARVKRELMESGLEVGGVRYKGRMTGYIRIEDLADRKIADHMHSFAREQVVEAERSLSDIIHVLTRHRHAFVRGFGGDVAGVIIRADIQKPVVRMWLFGMITLIEIEITQAIRVHYPNETWRSLLSEERLEKAREIVQERKRRGQRSELFDCLQFSDKGKIFLNTPALLEVAGLRSKNAARQVIKELESLRNNLAHSQDIVTHDWAQISRMTQRIEADLTS